MLALLQLVLGEELLRGDGLELPDVTLLPFALPFLPLYQHTCCMLVMFIWLGLSKELRPGIRVLEKRAMCCGCQCGMLCKAETTVTDLPLWG